MKSIRIKKACTAMVTGIFLLHCNQGFYAQPRQAAPRYFIGEDSTLYWNKALPVYIKLAPSPEGAGVNLVSREFEKYTNPVFLDTEGPNFIRTRYAVDKNTREVARPQLEVLFEVVADGEAPETTIHYKNANAFSSAGKQYYGRGLVYELASADKYAGVEDIHSAIDGENYQVYQQAVAVQGEGQQTIRFYSTDRVGNVEAVKQSVFISDLTAPVITHNINGISDSNTIASTSTIYFTATDNLSGVARTLYRFDQAPFGLYSGSNLNLQHLEDGDHVLEYYSEDHVGNRSNNASFRFYYDKLAPITASDILGDKYIWQDKVYFSGRTKMKLTAIDNKAGVKEIRYAIDNETFKTYDEPFYLPAVQGNHAIKFYSIDRLSNTPGGAEEYKHNINLVFLDLTGPDIGHSFNGPTFRTTNELFLGPKTTLVLNGKDNQSGLQYMAYSIDGAQAETRYEKPFGLDLPSGIHRIELFAYDQVNNRNVSEATVHFDSGSPLIIPNFSTNPSSQQEGLGVYPPYVVLFLAATDEIVGNDKIYYRLNDGPELIYSSPIGNLAPDKRYNIQVRAVDKVGNESTRLVSFFTAGR